MRGARLRGVIEVRDDFDRRTYRLMYTTFDEAIYALCAFPKKATSGIRTPKRLLALVEKRLRDARVIHAFEARR
jgi:phage-related protein